MAYAVIIRDDPSPGTIDKRLSVRNQHLEALKGLFQDGTIIEGGAITNDDGDMVGSVLLLNMENEASVRQLLEKDIYMTKGVWRDIDIIPLRLAPKTA